MTMARLRKLLLCMSLAIGLMPTGLFARDMPGPGSEGWAEIWAEVWEEVWEEVWTEVWERRMGTRDVRIAIFPFWGENPDIVAQFGQELYAAIREMDGFAPVRVDMENLPPYIPPGGFPPHISPLPSLMGGAPLAITGLVKYSPAMRQWNLRLYLWQVSDTRPIFADELVAIDRESLAAILPYMLNWLISWTDYYDPAEEEEVPVEEAPAYEPVYEYEEKERVPEYEDETPHFWEFPALIDDDPFYILKPPIYSTIFVGLNAGWNMQVLHDMFPQATDGALMARTESANLSASLSVYFQLINFQVSGLRFYLGPQTEIAFFSSPLGNGFMFPLLFRLTARWENWFVSPLVGAYLILPLDRSIQIGPDERSWGIGLGLGVGRELGMGHINIGFRWNQDMFSILDMNAYNRHMIAFTVGYEVGVDGLIRTLARERRLRREREL